MLLSLAVACPVAGCGLEERPGYGIVESAIPQAEQLPNTVLVAHALMQILTASISDSDGARFTEPLS